MYIYIYIYIYLFFFESPYRHTLVQIHLSNTCMYHSIYVSTS